MYRHSSCSRSPRSHGRTAVSTAEVIVAMILLTTAAVGVSRFVANAHAGLRDRELSARIGWELNGAREQIGSWQPTEITAERIQALPISAELSQRLQNPRWQATLTEVTEPLAALQVDLRFECLWDGQTATPRQLTFWVTTDEEPTRAD